MKRKETSTSPQAQDEYTLWSCPRDRWTAMPVYQPPTPAQLKKLQKQLEKLFADNAVSRFVLPPRAEALNQPFGD